MRVLRPSFAVTAMHCSTTARGRDSGSILVVSVGMFFCCGGRVAMVVLMQVHSCRVECSGHATLNTELDSVSWVRWRDDVFQTRVISRLSRDERGELLC